MTHAENGDCLILMSEPPRQGVDLGLALGGQRGEMRTVALKERLSVRRFPVPIANALRLEPWDQRRHAPDDLPVDLVELALALPARLLRARELDMNFGREGHVAILSCRPMKLDGPP